MSWFGRFVLDPATVEHLAWVLLHFVWQGVALGVVFAASMAALRERSPRSRYAAGCVTLAAMAAAPVATFFWLSGRFDDPGPLVAASTFPHALREPVRWMTARLGPHVHTLLNLWLAGVIALAVWQAGSWLWLQAALARLVPLRDEWRNLVAIAERMRIRGVRFAQTTMVSVPVTAGWLRPVVLIPVGALLGLTPAQLEAIVAHELAHVRRYDYLVNLLQGVVESLLFYHPAVWWVSRRVRAEREHCCDDIAASFVADKVAYAEALAALQRAQFDLPAHAVGATTGGRSELFRRVARILGHPAARLENRVGRPALGAVLATGLLLCGAANYLFGHAVAVRPERTPEMVRPVAAAVYDVLSADGGRGEAFLPALADAVRSLRAGAGVAADGEVLEALVESVGAASPDALEREIIARVSFASVARYETAADWRYGTGREREALVEQMSREAGRSHPSDPARAKRYARAAVLFAAQDAFRLGWLPVRRAISDERVTTAIDLAPRDSVRLGRFVSDQVALPRLCQPFEIAIARTLESLEAGSPRIAEVDGAIEDAGRDLWTLASVARSRNDVLWRVAQLKARLNRVARTIGRPAPMDDARLAAAAGDSEPLRRWLAEADAAGGLAKGDTVLYMTPAQLKDYVKRKGK